MDAYTKEYFYDYNDYQEILRNQPDKIVANGSMDFSFICFDRGAKVFLSENAEEINNIISFFNFDKNDIQYIGSINDIDDRITTECVKRKASDLETLIKEMYENKKFMLVFAPFKMSWHK